MRPWRREYPGWSIANFMNEASRQLNFHWEISLPYFKEKNCYIVTMTGSYLQVSHGGSISRVTTNWNISLYSQILALTPDADLVNLKHELKPDGIFTKKNRNWFTGHVQRPDTQKRSKSKLTLWHILIFPELSALVSNNLPLFSVTSISEHINNLQLFKLIKTLW